jgi:putative PEP-CTERM system histidine kinase
MVPVDHPLVRALGNDHRIAVLEDDSTFRAIPGAWLTVPLNHAGNLVGFVVLVRPRAPFRIDNEVRRLLLVVGHEVSSRLAEERATRVMAQTRELRDHSRRFAFMLHDIKSVSSQLSMLLANAEHHAENPEFQRDMLATVRASADKIATLLKRVRTGERTHGDTLIDPMRRLAKIIDVENGFRQINRIRFSRDAIDASQFATSHVAITPEDFDATVSHLLDNAVEASPASVRVSLGRDAFKVTIDITDDGPGMQPEFIRDQLFRPFASTKAGGHGIGVYQARELLRQAGGDLLVLSKPGAGTTMRIILPLADAALHSPRAAA